MVETENEVEFENELEFTSGRGYGNQRKSSPEMILEAKGWNLFSEEVGWFIYDFFKWDLNGYEKIIFYSYYINGMTLMEIASSADCSFQYIGTVIKKIEKKLGYRWKNRENWSIHDSQHSHK